MMYKMQNQIGPTYLSALLPTTVGDATTYNLRNNDNTQTINCRTTLYYNSFLPSSIRAWNTQSPEIRTASSLSTFVYLLNKDKVTVPKYYYTRNRLADILHTRLRTNCSSLNSHLYSKNITDNPNCVCGQLEDTEHFFQDCNIYINLRQELHNELAEICTPTTNILLYGIPEANTETNRVIFKTVQTYIRNTRRFVR